MKRTITLLLSIILVIVSGCQIDQGVELSNSSVLSNGTILIAAPNPNQTPPPDSNSNLMREYEIIAFDPTTGEEKLLTTTEKNYFVDSYGFYDNQIFFVGIIGGIYKYDLHSGKTSYVDIPGISPLNEYGVRGMIGENSVYEFTIDNGAIVYLKGHCSDGFACVLGEYDILSGENKTVIDNLQEQSSSVVFNHFEIHSYDHNSELTIILNSGGAVGYGGLAIYEIDINTGEKKKVDSGRYPDCGGGLFRDCEEEDLVEKEYVKEMIIELNYGIDECIGTKITKGDYMQDYTLTIDSEEYPKSYEKGVYIGCVE